MAPAALGLSVAAVLALVYVLSAGEAFGVVAGLVAAAAVCAGAVLHQRARVLRQAELPIRIETEALWVGARRIDRRRLRHGVVVPVEGGFVVQLRTSRLRQPVVLFFESESDANDLLRELGLAAEQTTATFLALSPWLARRGFAAALIGACIAALALGVAVVPLGWPPFIALIGFALLGIPLTMAALPSWFSVGLDGIAVGGIGRRRFYPWSVVESVTPFRTKSLLTDAGGVEIAIRGQEQPVRLATSTDPLVGDTPERLAARIAEARAAAGMRAAPIELSGNLEARVDAARAVLDGDGSYRRSHVDPAAVAALVADPAAPPESRVAAAIALVESDREAGPDRVRVAAETSVDRDLRAALEAASESEADEALAILAARMPAQR
jgi:hypothetical protein